MIMRKNATFVNCDEFSIAGSLTCNHCLSLVCFYQHMEIAQVAAFTSLKWLALTYKVNSTCQLKSKLRIVNSFLEILLKNTTTTQKHTIVCCWVPSSHRIWKWYISVCFCNPKSKRERNMHGRVACKVRQKWALRKQWHEKMPFISYKKPVNLL